MAIIKTLTIGGAVYEIYDESAHIDLAAKLNAVSTITSKSQIYIKLPDGSQSVTDITLVSSSGTDSLVLVTTDPARANSVLGNFAAALGSRNTIGEHGHESLVSGGYIDDDGENNLMAGYRLVSRVNQHITGGYRVTNNSSESLVVAERSIIEGTVTYNSDNDPKSDSKYNGVIGQYIYIGVGSVGNLVTGQEIGTVVNKQDESACVGALRLKNSLISGTSIHLGADNRWLYCLGDTIYVDDLIQDSLLVGFNHNIRNTTAGALHYIYSLGRDNTNLYNGTAYHDVYMIGNGLRANESDQVWLGNYNKAVSSCWFGVGCGDDTTRKTAFAVCNASNKYWIKIGNQNAASQPSGSNFWIQLGDKVLKDSDIDGISGASATTQQFNTAIANIRARAKSVASSFGLEVTNQFGNSATTLEGAVALLSNVTSLGGSIIPQGTFANDQTILRVEIHARVIGTDAFRDCNNIISAYIGSEIEEIGCGVFHQGFDSGIMSYVIIDCDTPPTLSSANQWSETSLGDGEGTTIYVPYNKVVAYRTAGGQWSDCDWRVNGFSRPYTFSTGDTLPTTSPEGLQLTWYSDPDRDWETQVTTVSNSAHRYYCRARAQSCFE